MSSFCYCCFIHNCSKHPMLVVPDQPKLSLARASCPNVLRITSSTVIANKSIKANTRFGPLIAPLSFQAPLSQPKFPVMVPNNLLPMFHDLTDEETCNWLKFVRFSPNDANLVCEYDSGNIYFITSRLIRINQEFYFDYSPTYRHTFAIYLSDSSSPSVPTTSTIKSLPTNIEMTIESTIENSPRISQTRKAAKNCRELLSILSFKSDKCSRKDDKKQQQQEEQQAVEEYRCECCTKCFKTNRGLQRHRYAHNRTGSFVCLFCREAFQHVKAMQQHVLCHRIDQSVPQRDKNDERQGLKIFVFPCPKCATKCLSYRQLRIHYQQKHLASEFVCSDCGKEFRQKKDYERHRNSLHNNNKQFACRICRRRYTRRQSLIIHMETIHQSSSLSLQRNSRPYKCYLCKMSFLLRISFVKHMKRTHSKLLRFPCPYCGLESSSKNNLFQHINTCHSKWPKLIQCTFVDPVNPHYIYLDLEVFLCHMCGMRITRRDCLKFHLVTKHLTWLNSCAINNVESEIYFHNNVNIATSCEPSSIGNTTNNNNTSVNNFNECCSSIPMAYETSHSFHLPNNIDLDNRNGFYSNDNNTHALEMSHHHLVTRALDDIINIIDIDQVENLDYNDKIDQEMTKYLVTKNPTYEEFNCLTMDSLRTPSHMAQDCVLESNKL